MNVILFILVLGVIILIHEFGHFYMARRAGIMCHEFSIGMGPAIYQKRKGEIVYSVRLIPLGGYVSMAGEGVEDMVKVGNRIGVNLNDSNEIIDIVLHNDVPHQLLGEVIDFDLSGKEGTKLFIELNINGEKTNFKVSKEAKYQLSRKKEVWLAPADRNFENKTLWQRFLVIFAGPALNFILAFFIFFIVAFFIGKPVASSIVGNVNNDITGGVINTGDEITKVNGFDVTTWKEVSSQIISANNNKAVLTVDGIDHNINLFIVIQGLGFTNQFGNDELKVGQSFNKGQVLKENDLITGIVLSDNSVNNTEYVNVTTWNELLEYIDSNSHKEYVHLRYVRNGETKESSYQTLKEKTLKKLNSSFVQYSAGIEQSRKFDILYPLYYPFIKTGDNIKQMWGTITLLFSPSSGVGLGDLSGPIGIFSLVSDARKQGAASFFLFVAFLSINIGFFNLLPIPALDGGRLMFIVYEGITKKKVSKKVENGLIMATFILLFALMIFVTFNDVGRLFGR